MDSMGVTGMSPLTMMSMHEQYPWMKEKKSARKQMQGRMHHPEEMLDFTVICMSQLALSEPCQLRLLLTDQFDALAHSQ